MESATSPGDEVLVPKTKDAEEKDDAGRGGRVGERDKKDDEKDDGEERETKTGSERRTEKVLAKGATSRKGSKGRSDSDSDEDFAP